jgi:uncharacterized protein
VALCAAGAFCAPSLHAASDPPQLVVPDASLATSPATRPAAAAQPDAHAPLPAGPARADIALVLPLSAADYARAAEAVRDGFVDAANAAGARDRVLVVAHGDGDVVAAFARARDAGR